MKFSIVVPAYNASCFLDDCIASVKAQTYPQWELLAVNDGSTDDTLQKLKQYAQKDERIRVFDQENSGQFFARRRGIESATGDYVLFLDSDDALEESCLATLYETLKTEQYDMVLYTGEIVLPDGTVKHRFGELGEKAISVTPEEIKEIVISSHRMNSLCIKAFHRDLFAGDEKDYTFIKGTACAEDKVQLLYPLTKAKKIYYIPDCLYCYRYRQQSAVHSITINRIPQFLANQMFTLLKEYMRWWDMADEQHRNLADLYYIRNYLTVYFNARNRCKTLPDRKKLHQFPWKQYLNEDVIQRIPSLRKQLTQRERLKLLIARCRL